MIRPAIAFAMVAQTALACPTAADLAGGVRITDADGSVDTYTDGGNSTIQQVIDFGDGGVARNTLAQGVYVLRLSVEEDGVLDLGSVLATTYDRAPAALPRPTANLKMRLRTTVTDQEGSYKEQQDHQWGESEPFAIGTCSYDSIPGTVRYVSEFDTIVETQRYLPAMEIAILTSYTFGDDPAEIYSPVAIEAVK